jgi:hypothetical protein
LHHRGALRSREERIGARLADQGFDRRVERDEIDILVE